MDILYEDKEILVVIKPAGIESQSSKGLEQDMVSLIKNHLSIQEGTDPYVGVVHRLDKPVAGVMVYAKTQEAAAVLSKQVSDKQGMKKMYRAVICGQPKQKEAKLMDYVVSDSKTNMTILTGSKTKGAKSAELSYKVMKKKFIDGEQICELDIELMTGRHHQIRAQLSGHGMPIVGDRKYNPEYNKKDDKGRPIPASGICGSDMGQELALVAVSLTIVHPKTRKTMTYTYKPVGKVWEL